MFLAKLSQTEKSVKISCWGVSFSDELLLYTLTPKSFKDTKLVECTAPPVINKGKTWNVYKNGK